MYRPFPIRFAITIFAAIVAGLLTVTFDWPKATPTIAVFVTYIAVSLVDW